MLFTCSCLGAFPPSILYEWTQFSRPQTKEKNIAYRMHDNAFFEISDVGTVQKLSDRINPEDLHKVLDVLDGCYCPLADSLGLRYTWTVQQIECATDIMFKHPENLASLYDEIVRTAIFTVKPDNIATFLGQHITYNCKKKSKPTLTSGFSERGSNIIWVMYQLKCMISLAMSYG